MAQTARIDVSSAQTTPVEDTPHDDASSPQLTIDDPSAASKSPARAMQETLGREFAMVEATEENVWPLRQTVALVMLGCGAFWTAVYFAVAAFVG
ncbi:MAG: hypothetical protein AAF603_11810 [Pseudomonadota bacterium]